MKTPQPHLLFTKDLTRFIPHKYNRDVKKKEVLVESMRKYGFLPSSPLHVVRNGHGKFFVARGHHRHEAAREVGCGVWYVIDRDVNLFDIEGVPQQSWTSNDFTVAHAKAGEEAYAKLDTFRREHRINIGTAASLLAGKSAAGHKALKAVKQGTFKLAPGTHAADVVGMIDLCRKANVSFAGTSSFVGALSMAVLTPGVDLAQLRHKLGRFGGMMRRRGHINDYLEELEATYNYQSRGPKFPLRLKAMEASKARSPIKSKPKEQA